MKVFQPLSRDGHTESAKKNSHPTRKCQEDFIQEKDLKKLSG